MHSVYADLQVCAGDHVNQIAKVPIQLQLELLCVFALVSVLNGLDYMYVHIDMHAAESLACDKKHYLPCLLRVSYWDGSLTCMGPVSSASARCTHCCS